MCAALGYVLGWGGGWGYRSEEPPRLLLPWFSELSKGDRN